MLAHVREPRRVLDLASGTGIVTFRIAERWPACEVLGVELQPEYLEIARRRAEERGLPGRVRFVCAKAEEAPLERGAYDHVVSSYLPKYADLAALMPRLFDALELQVCLDDLRHLGLDRREVFFRQRPRQAHVVVKALLGRRSKRQLHTLEQPHHRLRHHVRARVAHDRQRLRVFLRQNA